MILKQDLAVALNSIVRGPERKSIVVLDGQPGIGKTTLAKGLSYGLNGDVRHALVGMDMDVLSRKERGDKEIVMCHPGEIVREAVRRHLGQGGELDAMVHSSLTGTRDIERKLIVPGVNNGILIVEGVGAILAVREELGRLGVGLNRVVEVLLTGPQESIEARRQERDIQSKGLPEAEAERRVRDQRATLEAFYRDLSEEMKSTRGREVLVGNFTF